MNRILALSAALALAALFACPAAADDMASMSPGGWYIGLNVGGTGGAFTNVSYAVTPGGHGGNVSGGAQLGYQWPSGEFVGGIEADVDAIDVRARSAFSKFDEDWSSTVRARLGMPCRDWTPFVSLGVGFTDVNETLIGFGSHSDVRTGIAAGAGLEFARSDNWTVRLEYLYVDVPKKLTHIAGVPFDGGSGNHTVRIDFDYPL